MALIFNLPLPVLYASTIPDLPLIIPPVGKSGPGIKTIRSSTEISGLSISAKHALIVSFRLWGGMFVAIPTAIPEEPLASRLGILEGRTSGMISVPS